MLTEIGAQIATAKSALGPLKLVRQSSYIAPPRGVQVLPRHPPSKAQLLGPGMAGSSHLPTTNTPISSNSLSNIKYSPPPEININKDDASSSPVDDKPDLVNIRTKVQF